MGQLPLFPFTGAFKGMNSAAQPGITNPQCNYRSTLWIQLSSNFEAISNITIYNHEIEFFWFDREKRK